MSSFVTDSSRGIMQPDAFRMVQGVFKRIKAEGHLPKSGPVQQEFAAYLLRMYFREMVIEEALYDIGVAAAKANFQTEDQRKSRDVSLHLTKVLIVEDDYFLASDVKRVFEKAGATVIGPIGKEDLAISLLQDEVPDLAIIDLNLGDGVSFNVAEHLLQQSVPICIWTAYKRAAFRELPDSLRSVAWLEKPVEPKALLQVAASALT